MKASLFAISALIAIFGATAAVAAPACSGDFKWVDGGWVSDPQCQRGVAESLAAGEHEKIVRHPMNYREVTRAQFCLGNENIATDIYCAPYKD